MKLKDANLNVSALANVDQLIESMLVDEPVNGVFISFITCAIHDVKTAVTNAAHDVKTAATNAAHYVTAIASAADGAAVAKPPQGVQMTKNIALRLKNNSVEALTLQQLLVIREEALN